MNSRRILRQVSLYAVLLRILGGKKPVVAGQILRKEIFCRGSRTSFDCSFGTNNWTPKPQQLDPATFSVSPGGTTLLSRRWQHVAGMNGTGERGMWFDSFCFGGGFKWAVLSKKNVLVKKYVLSHNIGDVGFKWYYADSTWRYPLKSIVIP